MTASADGHSFVDETAGADESDASESVDGNRVAHVGNEKLEERMTASHVAKHRRHNRFHDQMSAQQMTKNFMNL